MAVTKKAQPSITITFNDEALTLFGHLLSLVGTTASVQPDLNNAEAIPQNIPDTLPKMPYVTPAPILTEPNMLSGSVAEINPTPIAPVTLPTVSTDQTTPAMPQAPVQTATPFNGGFAPLPTAAASEITLEQIMRAGGQLASQMASRPELSAALQELLQPYGGTAQGIPKEQYGAVVTRLRQLGAQI